MDKATLYKEAFELSLNMLIELPYQEVIEAAKAIGDYNEFNAHDLEKMMSMIDAIIPRKYYNEGNPNNGNRDYKISIGREGSMVLYYSIYKLYSEGTIKTIKRREEELKTIAEGVGKADEFNVYEEDNYLKIRIWWD